MTQNHTWTDDERDIIRRDYKHTRKSRQELTARLGVTEYGVAGQISSMGIAKSDDQRPRRNLSLSFPNHLIVIDSSSVTYQN